MNKLKEVFNLLNKNEQTALVVILEGLNITNMSKDDFLLFYSNFIKQDLVNQYKNASENDKNDLKISKEFINVKDTFINEYSNMNLTIQNLMINNPDTIIFISDYLLTNNKSALDSINNILKKKEVNLNLDFLKETDQLYIQLFRIHNSNYLNTNFSNIKNVLDKWFGYYNLMSQMEQICFQDLCFHFTDINTVMYKLECFTLSFERINGLRDSILQTNANSFIKEKAFINTYPPNWFNNISNIFFCLLQIDYFLQKKLVEKPFEDTLIEYYDKNIDELSNYLIKMNAIQYLPYVCSSSL